MVQSTLPPSNEPTLTNEQRHAALEEALAGQSLQVFVSQSPPQHRTLICKKIGAEDEIHIHRLEPQDEFRVYLDRGKIDHLQSDKKTDLAAVTDALILSLKESERLPYADALQMVDEQGAFKALARSKRGDQLLTHVSLGFTQPSTSEQLREVATKLNDMTISLPIGAEHFVERGFHGNEVEGLFALGPMKDSLTGQFAAELPNQCELQLAAFKMVPAGEWSNHFLELDGLTITLTNMADKSDQVEVKAHSGIVVIPALEKGVEYRLNARYNGE